MPNRPVGPSVYRNYQFLKTLGATKSEKKRQNLLKNASRDELLSIVEAAHNLLAIDPKTHKPRYHLTSRQLSRLVPFAETVRKISKTRSESGARRQIQRGGAIGALLPLLAPVLVEVARSIISSAVKDS
jgi:hypothetical protein